MKKPDFLVFSDDFGEHPSSCQHIFRYVPKQSTVLWVNTIGMRSPKLNRRDFHKASLKLKKMGFEFFRKSTKNTSVARKGINICQPPMLPFVSAPGAQAFNRMSVCHVVKERMRRLRMTEPILIITAPNACDYVGQFGERRCVYYCVDDFAEWPGLNKKLVTGMEDRLARKADILIATSQDLVDKLVPYGNQVHLLTHGVDYSFFKNTPEGEHALLKEVPKPRVGYFGLFDDRSDQKLLKVLAERMPDVSFVITGDTETDILQMEQFGNIYFTGKIPYNELPAMAKGWNACMLPYKVNKLTNAIQPLKIKEYLATEKPVISTPIKEACCLKKYIAIAETVTDWERNIRKMVTELPLEEQNERNTFLKQESWAAKAQQFFDICLKEY